MRKIKFAAILIIFMIINFNCKILKSEKEIFVKGFYTLSFEHSGFISCDSAQTFWVKGNEKFLLRYKELVKSMGTDTLSGGYKYNPTKVYCELIGSLSKKGKYGHLGVYDYEFQVKEIIKMEIPENSNCQN